MSPRANMSQVVGREGASVCKAAVCREVREAGQGGPWKGRTWRVASGAREDVGATAVLWEQGGRSREVEAPSWHPACARGGLQR